MGSVIVTGANKGLGFEFTRQLAAKSERVFACCRSPDQARELHELAAANERVTLHRLDVNDPKNISSFADELDRAPIDLLINNAGIIDTSGASFSETNRKTLQALGRIPYDGWADVFQTNVIGPMRLTEALIPNVAASSRKKIVMISSTMGSITMNQPDNFPPGGGLYVYRSSKAALNMVTRSLAADLKVQDIVVLVLNPGWVKTSMGGADAFFEPGTSVANMLRAIDASSLADTGQFISYDGSRVPW